VAFRTGRAEELPAARPRKPLPERAATCLMLSRGGEVMLQRRPPTGIWGGLWSLPELPEDTSAQAWCRTHYGATVDVRAPLPCVLHTFTHFRLTITPLPCRVQRIEAKAQEPGLLWLGREDIAGAALPAPIKRLLLDASGAF
jgi:A/G-specific adenine glycosylase